MKMFRLEIHYLVTFSEVGDFLMDWVLAPIILVGLLVLSIYLTFHSALDSRQRWSNFFGMLFGVLLASVVIVYERRTGFGTLELLQQGFHLKLLASGGLAGLILMLLADKFFSGETTKFFVMPLTAASSTALAFYVANEAYRQAMSAICFGMLLGIVGYCWLFSGVIDDLFGSPKKESKRSSFKRV